MARQMQVAHFACLDMLITVCLRDYEMFSLNKYVYIAKVSKSHAK